MLSEIKEGAKNSLFFIFLLLQKKRIFKNERMLFAEVKYRIFKNDKFVEKIEF